MRYRIAYLLLALGAAAALGGCGSTSDRPLQTTLQALKVKASQTELVIVCAFDAGLQ